MSDHRDDVEDEDGEDTSWVKWVFIAIASPMIMFGVEQSVDSYSRNMAHRDIVVACYQAHEKNCDSLP